MVYVLILFAHVGMMGSGNSNSITTQEFTSREACLNAREVAESMSSGSTKIIKAECVQK